ncbi:hypothetical protein, partial [Nonomuraea sp. bgisy101]|uniref:hypothetical protein n=1 Tax=Nonomuraea sp. bgisy101 TaxID=3413784 RepID=UPI003D742B1F
MAELARYKPTREAAEANQAATGIQVPCVQATPAGSRQIRTVAARTAPKSTAAASSATRRTRLRAGWAGSMTPPVNSSNDSRMAGCAGTLSAQV